MPADLPTTRIFLVRHGAAEGADGIAVGQVDLPLSTAGAEASAGWRAPGTVRRRTVCTPRLSAEKVGSEKLRLPAPEGFVLIDTDGDGEVDTFLPGTSNFYPTGEQEVDKIGICDGPNGEVCHSINGTCHCVE